MLLAIFWRRTVLPVRGGATISIALTHPDRRHEVDDPHVHVFRIGFEHQAPIRVKRREIYRSWRCR